MRTTTLIATLAAAAGIVGAGTTLVPAFAQERGTPGAAQQTWMTLPQVQVKLEATGYRDVSEIERKRDKYEVKATDLQGQRVELDVDPFTADVLKTEVKRNR